MLSLAVLAACGTQALRGDGDGFAAGHEALENDFVDGSELPAKTLILSYDDGPGDRSEELSTYLRQQGIRATFFVTGWQTDAHPGVLARIAADGHRIANHTQTHTNMTTQSAEAVRSEVQSVDNLIAPFNADGHYFFRPPYFAWSAAVRAAFVGTALDRYIGPVRADIGNTMADNYAADWACWQEAHISSAACADLYMNEIRARDHGIVLLHDPWGDAAGNTVDMTKNLVPRLKAEGYLFATLEAVPAIRAQLPPPPQPDAGAGADAGRAVDASSPPAPDAAVVVEDAGVVAVSDASLPPEAFAAATEAASPQIAAKDAGRNEAVADAAVVSALAASAAPASHTGCSVARETDVANAMLSVYASVLALFAAVTRRRRRLV